MKCPACGGTLIYMADEKILKCEYCDSIFDPEQYNKDNSGSKTDVYEDGLKVDRYLCNRCGAELCAPEEQIVSYCLYCGGEATLVQKADVIDRPTGIIPFKFSKEEVQNKYKKSLAKKLFVPKEFKDPKFIEGFRGVYIPYWDSGATVNQETAKFDGETFEYKGGYDYTRYYDYKVKFDGAFDSGSFDASEAFDDTIAAEISPFHKEQIEPFNESYLAGFYADKVTVPIETYKTKIDENMVSAIKKEMEIATEGVVTKPEKIKETLTWEITKKKSLLFPVWFLTWKSKDRVAYSVMNGETGKISMDLPVDLKKFFLAATGLALGIFLILCMIPTFVIPIKIAGYASILLYFSSLILNGEFKKIMLMETHAYDLGSKQKKEEPKEKKKGCLQIFKGMGYIAQLLIIGGMILRVYTAKMSGDIFFPLLWMFIFQLFLCIKQCKNLSKIQKKGATIIAIISVVLQFVSMAVVLTNVQEDYWYYFIAGLGLIGMSVNIITCTSYINYLTTRPAPNFFTREGANNGR